MLFGLLILISGELSLHAQPFARWVAVNGGTIPVNAFVGGWDGQPEYVCRGTHQGATHPGKTFQGNGRCYIEFANTEVSLTTFEVLLDFGGAWVPASNGVVPAGSFQTGTEGGQALFSCRAYVGGGMQIGKIRPGFDACNIGNNGPVRAADYEVLRNVWVAAANGTVPANALAAGNESGGQPLFICRGATAGGIHVGKVRPGFTEGCRTAFNQQSVPMATYEVMTTDVTPLWLPAPNGVPPGAFNTGSDGGAGLFYTCRAMHQGGLQIGKTGVAATTGVCRLEFANAGVDVGTYEVLGVQAADWTGTYKIFTKETRRFWGEAATGDRLISTRTTVADDAFARFTFQKQANSAYRILAGSGRHLHEDASSDKFLSTRFQPDDGFTRFVLQREADGANRIRVQQDNTHLHENGLGDRIISSRFQEANDDYSRFYLVKSTAQAPPVLNPTVSSFSLTPNILLSAQPFSFTVNGTNFDTATARVLFTSTAVGANVCPAATPCPGILSTRTATQLAGTAALAGGTYTMSVANAAGNPATVTAFTVSDAPVNSISVSPALLTFQHQLNGVAPPAQTIQIPGRGTAIGGLLRTFSVDLPSVTWLSVTPSGGTAPQPDGATITVNVFPAGLAVGTQSTTLRIRFTSEGLTADVPVSITVQDSGPPAGANTNQLLSHIADSAGWQTTITLVNLDTEAAPFSLRFFGSQATGRSPSVPLEMAFVGLPGRTSIVDGVIPARGSRTIQTAGTDSFLNMGWVELVSAKRIAGSGVFRDMVGRQEAAVGLTSSTRAFLLPFDNVGGRGTSFALINNSSQAITVTATVRDENGNQLALSAIALLPRGHTATESTNQFPASANQRGTLEFSTPNADISGLGIRFDAPFPGVARAFTSFPVQPRP